MFAWRVWDVEFTDDIGVFNAPDIITAIQQAQEYGYIVTKAEFYMCVHDDGEDAGNCIFKHWN